MFATTERQLFIFKNLILTSLCKWIPTFLTEGQSILRWVRIYSRLTVSPTLTLLPDSSTLTLPPWLSHLDSPTLTLLPWLVCMMTTVTFKRLKGCFSCEYSNVGGKLFHFSQSSYVANFYKNKDSKSSLVYFQLKVKINQIFYFTIFVWLPIPECLKAKPSQFFKVARFPCTAI